MKDRKITLLRLLLAVFLVLTLAFIWGNSMLSGQQSSDVSNGLLYKLRPMFALFGVELQSDLWLRKLAHFCEFAALGAELHLLYTLSVRPGRESFVSCSLLSLLAATVDETIQFYSGRYSHIHDVLLDLGGGMFGAALVLLTVKLWLRRERNKEPILDGK